MKATRIFLANHEEHAQAQKMGFKDKPPVEKLETEFYFSLNGLTMAYINPESEIIITLFGQQIILKYEKKVWDKITSCLE